MTLRTRPSHCRGLALPSLAVALALVACSDGGGGGDSDGLVPDGTSAGGDDLIVGSVDAPPADDVETDTLRRNAADGAARGLGVGLRNLRILGDDATGGEPLPGSMNQDALAELESASGTLSDRLLGIDDPGARVTRSGNVITVDPDDASLCADDELGLFGAAPEDPTGLSSPTDDALADCLALVTDLTVRLDARTEESGIITYLFAREPVVALGYSPDGASGELYLGGLQSVTDRIDTIERGDAGGAAGAEDPRTTATGTLRLDVRALGGAGDGSGDDTADEVVAEVELSVTEAIAIGEEGTEAGLSLAPSRVLLLGVDEGTGEVRLSVDWGVLRLVAESGDSDGNRELTTLNLGGLSLDLTVTEGDSAISLANVGIGGVPLTVQVGQNDALTLALETFGVTLDAESGVVTFDTDVGIDLMLDNIGGFVEERTSAYTARFTADVPSGTELEEVVGFDGTSATRVRAGGPVTASLLETDETGSTQVEIDVGLGACFGGAGGDEAAVGIAPFDPLAELETGSLGPDVIDVGPLDDLAPAALDCPSGTF